MPTQIQTDVAEIQRQVYAEDYYPNLWVESMKLHNMTRGGIENGLYPDRDVINLCQSMWERLPETNEIRRPPFFDISKIAEHTF